MTDKDKATATKDAPAKTTAAKAEPAKAEPAKAEPAKTEQPTSTDKTATGTSRGGATVGGGETSTTVKDAAAAAVPQSTCVVNDGTLHVGNATPGSKVCSAHAMHYKADGTPR